MYIGLLFHKFFVFQDTENNANCDAESSKCAKTLTPFSKEDNLVCMNVKVTTLGSEQRLDEEQRQQAAGEVRNSRQASGQQQTQCAY